MNILPAVRLLRHPGPIAPRRWESVEGTCARSFRLSLRAGDSLHRALVEPLRGLGVGAAAINLHGGVFSRIAYCLAMPREGARQVICYSSPTELRQATRMVSAGLTLGEDEEAEPMLHCHALLVDEHGRLIGGHLLTERCIVQTPVAAYVYALDDVRLARRYDPEISLAVFQPEPRGGRDEHH